MSNVSSVVNLFSTANEGFSTILASTILSGATTVPLASVTGLTNGSVFVGIIEPGGTNQQVFTGTVNTSSVEITGVVWTRGTNVGHVGGATIVDYVTGTDWNMATTGILVEHLQSGKHGAITPTSVVSAGGVTGTTITGTSIVNTGDNQIYGESMTTIKTETQFDYVASGGVWSGDSYNSTLYASMTAIVVYQGGQRLAVAAVTSHLFTGSKDTYIDILNTSGVGSVVYTAVANNAASPSLAANSVRIGIIVSGASSIAAATSVNQGQETMVLPVSTYNYSVCDSLGNLICPRDPNRRILGYRQILSGVTNTASSATLATGLSCPVIIPTGRKVSVRFVTGFAYCATSSHNVYLTLWEGASVGTLTTQIGMAKVYSINNQVGTSIDLEVPRTPIVSNPVFYSVALHGDGTVTNEFDAASGEPAYIEITLV